jgi:hypothetical protein
MAEAVCGFHGDAGFSFYGTIGDRSKFRGTSMRVKTSGSATLQLRGGLNESYHITYPSLDVTGLLTSACTWHRVTCYADG